jgi:hypothetical protein
VRQGKCTPRESTGNGNVCEMLLCVAWTGTPNSAIVVCGTSGQDIRDRGALIVVFGIVGECVGSGGESVAPTNG